MVTKKSNIYLMWSRHCVVLDQFVSQSELPVSAVSPPALSQPSTAPPVLDFCASSALFERRFVWRDFFANFNRANRFRATRFAGTKSSNLSIPKVMWKEERRFGELNIENAETTIDENKVESDRDVIPFPPSECHNSLPYSYFVTAIQPNWSLFFEQHIDVKSTMRNRFFPTRKSAKIFAFLTTRKIINFDMKKQQKTKRKQNEIRNVDKVSPINIALRS